MAKGDYTKKYGGSRSGYEKGRKDTINLFIKGIAVVVGIVSTVLLAKKKK